MAITWPVAGFAQTQHRDPRSLLSNCCKHYKINSLQQHLNRFKKVKLHNSNSLQSRRPLDGAVILQVCKLSTSPFPTEMCKFLLVYLEIDGRHLYTNWLKKGLGDKA